MSDTANAREPSMEDILASIRRIIDEEDTRDARPASDLEVETQGDDALSDAGSLPVMAATVRRDDPEEEPERDDGGEEGEASVFPERESVFWSRATGRDAEESGHGDADESRDAAETTDGLSEDKRADIFTRAQNKLGTSARLGTRERMRSLAERTGDAAAPPAAEAADDGWDDIAAPDRGGNDGSSDDTILPDFSMVENDDGDGGAILDLTDPVERADAADDSYGSVFDATGLSPLPDPMADDADDTRGSDDGDDILDLTTPLEGDAATGEAEDGTGWPLPLSDGGEDQGIRAVADADIPEPGTYSRFDRELERQASVSDLRDHGDDGGDARESDAEDASDYSAVFAMPDGTSETGPEDTPAPEASEGSAVEEDAEASDPVAAMPEEETAREEETRAFDTVSDPGPTAFVTTDDDATGHDADTPTPDAEPEPISNAMAAIALMEDDDDDMPVGAAEPEVGSDPAMADDDDRSGQGDEDRGSSASFDPMAAFAMSNVDDGDAREDDVSVSSTASDAVPETETETADEDGDEGVEAFAGEPERETEAVADEDDEDDPRSPYVEDEDDIDRELGFTDTFGASDVYHDEPPVLDEDYSRSLEDGDTHDADRAAFAAAAVPRGTSHDDMETVGGMVRDALDRDPVDYADPSALVSMTSEEISARALASLADVEGEAGRRVYGALKISENGESESLEGMVRGMLRPMLREWLDDNLPSMVETAVRGEVERISAKSRKYSRAAEND